MPAPALLSFNCICVGSKYASIAVRRHAYSRAHSNTASCGGRQTLRSAFVLKPSHIPTKRGKIPALSLPQSKRLETCVRRCCDLCVASQQGYIKHVLAICQSWRAIAKQTFKPLSSVILLLKCVVCPSQTQWHIPWTSCDSFHDLTFIWVLHNRTQKLCLHSWRSYVSRCTPRTLSTTPTSSPAAHLAHQPPRQQKLAANEDRADTDRPCKAVGQMV